MTAQNLGQQIVVGVVIGVAVMVVMAYLQRKNILPPPVAQEPEEKPWYESIYGSVEGFWHEVA